MTVSVEVWPLAADEAGIWLLSGGDAWRFGPVEAASDVHYEVEWLMFQHDIDPESVSFIDIPGRPVAEMVHSTSWRPDGPSIVLTYMAVVRASGYMRERWPDAAPITADVAEAVGRPPTHAANEAPIPRMVDVLFHGLRHLKYLQQTDRTTADAMGETWKRHLEPFTPALAGMYSEPHRAA